MFFNQKGMDDFLKRNAKKHEAYTNEQKLVYLTERLYFKMKGGINRVKEGVATIDEVFDGGQKYYDYCKTVVEEADACILDGGRLTVSLYFAK